MFYSALMAFEQQGFLSVTRLYLQTLRTHVIHTLCQAFSTETCTTRFFDIGISGLNSNTHPSACETNNTQNDCATVTAVVVVVVVVEVAVAVLVVVVVVVVEVAVAVVVVVVVVVVEVAVALVIVVVVVVIVVEEPVAVMVVVVVVL